MKRRDKAFTLMEVLLVVAILVILAAFAVPALIKQFSKGQEGIAEAAIGPNGPFATALKFYKRDVGTYPPTEPGLQALLEKPEDVEENVWDGPYLEKGVKLEDPWKTPYIYKFPGENNTDGYDLSSAGPDKEAGNEDDIVNWTKEETGGGTG